MRIISREERRVPRPARWLVALILLVLAASSALPAAAAPASHPTPYPAYIRVGRTFTSRCIYPPPVKRVDVVPFKTYVKNVLPNEWYASWTTASLNAGAVAVAQFAYTTGFVQRKWSRHGYAFDVVDSTCDQFYVPGRAHLRTSAAVDRMWGVQMLRNNRLITPYYRATAGLCGAIRDCMSQWGSQRLGQQGYTGVQILHAYYGPVSVVR